MTEFKDVVKHAEDANHNLWTMLSNSLVTENTTNKDRKDFLEIVEHHTSSEQNLWKIIALLLQDVNALQKKFKEIEELETKSV